ncbi:IS3 family transposase [Peribacillus frigoritolerans]
MKALVQERDYYNHQRIKVKLKGISPVDFRVHALKVA